MRRNNARPKTFRKSKICFLVFRDIGTQQGERYFRKDYKGGKVNREEFEQKRELRRWKERREDYQNSDTIQDYCEERKIKEAEDDEK